MRWPWQRREWKPSAHYAECRRLAERRLGDLRLPHEIARPPRVGGVTAQSNTLGQPWPERGAPFDEYDSEGRLHGLDRQEHIEMRRWCGRARAVPPGYDASGSPVPPTSGAGHLATAEASRAAW